MGYQGYYDRDGNMRYRKRFFGLTIADRPAGTNFGSSNFHFLGFVISWCLIAVILALAPVVFG